MKKRMLLMLLALSMSLALTACSDPLGAACPHRDADDDGKCDTCAEDFEDGVDVTVCQHRDADDDGKCDECDEDYEDGVDVTVCQHRDADDDGKCDECDEDYEDGRDLECEHSYGEWVAEEEDADLPCDQQRFYSICTGCGDAQWKTGGYENHSLQTVTYASTCTVQGYDENTCSACGFSERVNYQPLAEHSYKTTYSADADFHWFDCENCEATSGVGAHTADASGYCTACDLPISSSEGVEYALSADGTYAEVVGYNGNETRIVIASEYDGVPVRAIAEIAFRNKEITSVVIPDSVTMIANSAFQSCKALTEVTLGGFVESIGSSAFYDCTSLMSITLPNGLKEIGDWAFCMTAIESVTIPESVEVLGGYLFYGCAGLSSVTILGAPMIGNFAFYNCAQELYTEYENGIYVGDAENPYAVLFSLTDKTLSTYTIHEDTECIVYAVFENCANLTSITLPDHVKTIGKWAFAGCMKLSSVTLGASLKTIGHGAFRTCTALMSITIPDRVKVIDGYAFAYCSALASVTLGGAVESIGTYAFYDCDSLVAILVPDSVKTIGDWAFANSAEISSVTIGSSVERIGYSVIAGCDALASVEFKNPEGWWVAADENATSGTAVSAEILSDTVRAADYLRSAYLRYYWSRG